jgi:hypothetical protein
MKEFEEMTGKSHKAQKRKTYENMKKANTILI